VSTYKSTDPLRSDLPASTGKTPSLLGNYLYEIILGLAAVVLVSLVLLLMRFQG